MDAISSVLLLLFLALVAFFFKPAKDKNAKNLPPNIPQNIVSKILWLKVSMLTVGDALRRVGSSLGPIVTVYFGPFPAIFVLDRKLIHEAFVKKGAAFSDRPLFAKNSASARFSSNGFIISFSRGAISTLLRRNMTSQILNSSGTKSFSSHRKYIIRLLLRELREKAQKDGGLVGIVGLFRSGLFQLVSLMCFGKLEDGLVHRIEMNHRGLVDIFAKLSVFDLMPTIAKVLFFKRWRKFIAMRETQEALYTPVIQDIRRRRDKEGILGHSYTDTVLALDIPVDGGTKRKATDNEVVSLCHEFFTTGMETTITTIEWAMANIIKHPHIQSTLLEEINRVVPVEIDTEDIEEESLLNMPYLKAVIYETLRRHPPVEVLLPHSNPQGDEKIGPYFIPKGSLINAILDVGMDGEVWADPHEFRPERFLVKGKVDEFDEDVADITGSNKDIKLIPFGLGRRLCPGIAMAMLHLRYFLACMVREFEWKTAGENDEVDLSHKIVFSIVMKNQLNARIRRRKSA